MRVGARGGYAAASGACDEALLQKIWLVHLTDGVGFLTNSSGETLDADGTAVELVNDGGENRAIHTIESARIDLQQLQCAERDLAGDDRGIVDLGIIAHTPQQSIRD